MYHNHPSVVVLQDSVVSKPKGKKKKVKTTHTKEHWDDLFTLPERPARGSETSPDEEAKNIGYVPSSDLSRGGGGGGGEGLQKVYL